MQVAELARDHAQAACPGDSSLSVAAYTAGLLHDLGKYQLEWLRYLTDSVAKRPAKSVPHAIYGAAHAKYNLDHPAILLSVAGHHAGLPNFCDVCNNLEAKEATFRATLNAVLPSARSELTTFPDTELAPPFPGSDPETCLRYEFWTRMLFSVLVDADRLDTERFSTGRGRSVVELAPAVLLEQLDHVRRIRAAERPNDPLTILRNRVFDGCRSQGEQESQGFFELTVPTGGGKTFSGMAFALAHARRWNLRRVIVVIPFLSIIEQNAREYQTNLRAACPGDRS